MYHWSRITESGTVVGMRALLFAYQVFGRIGFRFFMLPVMAYYFWARRDARKASQSYLEKIRPLYLNEASEKLTTFRHFLSFGEVLLDKLLAWMGQLNLGEVDYQSDGCFEQNHLENKGGVIIVSHLGNTEISHAIAQKQPNIKLNLLVYTQHAKKFNALLKKYDQRHIEMIQVTEITPAFAMMMSERVSAGEYIAIAGDRTPVTRGHRTSKVTLLGEQALLPQGAYILASLLKCPVYLLFCLKERQKYTIYLEKFSEQVKLNRQNRALSIEKYAQAYAKRLEYYCLKAPLQWFNFYDFWLESTRENHGAK